MAGISHSQHYGPDYRGLLKAEALDTVPFIRPTLGAYVDFPVARWLGVRQESIFFYPGFKAAGRTAPAERYVADVIESLSLRLLVKLSVTTGRGSLAAFAGPALDFPLGDFYHYRESVLAGTQEYSGLFPKAAIASVVGGLGFAFDLHGGSICLDLRGTVGLGDMYGLAPPYETWAAGDPVQDDRYWSVAALVGYERSFPPSRPLPRR
jgi:hypothetical protein